VLRHVANTNIVFRLPFQGWSDEKKRVPFNEGALFCTIELMLRTPLKIGLVSPLPLHKNSEGYVKYGIKRAF
jgi:hypothetical protein